MMQMYNTTVGQNKIILLPLSPPAGRPIPTTLDMAVPRDPAGRPAGSTSGARRARGDTRGRGRRGGD
jgi:hypothetical protein